MSELNEQVNVLVEDASVITVPIDDTLQNSGEAADAKAVGDALALKADIASVVAISVNGESADNQGAILIDGGDIPVSSIDPTKIDVAIGDLQTKDASAIIYENAETIKTHVDAIDADTVHVSAQTLTDEQKVQARTNIGALGQSAIANIGTVVTGTLASSATVASQSYTSIGEITLAAGTWIIWGGFSFGSAITTGIGAGYISEGENMINGTRSRSLAGSSYKGGYVVMAIVQPIESTTYYLTAYQNSGSSNTYVDANFKAVRIA